MNMLHCFTNELNQTQNMSIFSAGGQGKLKDHLTVVYFQLM